MGEDKEQAQQPKVLKVFVWENIAASDKLGSGSKEDADGTQEKE